MKPSLDIRRSLKFAAVLCMIAPAESQQTQTGDSASKVARHPQRATALIRRETEVGIAERDKIFARLKELARASSRLRGVNPAIMLERVASKPDDDEADVAAPPRSRFMIAERTFDRYVLGGMADPDSARAYLESVLTERIDAIDPQHRLTPDQRNKLLLAGRGDIKHLFDQIEEERREFKRLRTDVRGCQIFLRELEPLVLSVQQGPFDADSLLAKTLKKMSAESAVVGRTGM